ncbi:MAG: FecR domain-containing protein [Dysgonamonadaceae bacterium]|jgi:hypothetical protein|nr:FecR domain-containing protein [Dysgonamonadaceae bacterium]
MTDKYTTFKAEDFVQDDFFIASTINPTDVSNKFWTRLRYAGAIDGKEEIIARKIIDSLQVEPETLPNDEKTELWIRIKQSNKTFQAQKVRRLRRFLYSVSGVAAALFVFVAVGRNFLHREQIAATSAIEQTAPPTTKSTDIQLVLGDEKTLNLEGEEASITCRDEKVVMKSSENGEKTEEIKTETPFNQLIVPLGKRATLTLPDNSLMTVNAGSRVVFPSIFDKDKREIFIDGEAYIDVAKDAARPFIVKTDHLTLEALGTAFDVNTYRQDKVHYVVLVEGLVQVSHNNGSKTILKPSELYSCDANDFSVKTVNTHFYTSWKNGVLQFDSEPLGNIILRLSRYYGQTIDCSLEAADLRCTGILELKDDLRKVLEGIALTAPIKIAYNENKYLITNILKDNTPMYTEEH